MTAPGQGATAAAVSPGRALLRQHRLVAAAFLAAALLLRVLVPAGYMPVSAGGVPTLVICPGKATAMAGHAGHGRDMPAPMQERCAFADLSLPALGGADAPLIAAALVLAFVAAIIGRIAPPPTPAPFLRPPLRGPPLPA